MIFVSLPIVLSILTVLATSTAKPTSPTPLKLTAIIEGLCSHSMDFITNQLVPNIDALNDYLDVEFVPFGKANSTGQSQPPYFVCQHGTVECWLNSVMSCSLARVQDQLARVEYVGCQMHNGSDQTGQTCVEKYGLSWNDVNACASGDEGLQLQLKAQAYEQRLIGYPVAMPTIVYDDQYDQANDDGSKTDFKSVACRLLKSAHDQSPPACA